MWPKTDLRIRTEKLAQKKFERAFEVSDADVFVDVKAFDLMELGAVSGIDFISPIRRTRSDNAYRRRRTFHRSNLNGGSVRPQNTAIRQIEGVLFVAGRMIRWSVKGIKAMPFGLDVRSFSEGETHPAKNCDRAVEHLGQGMKRPASVCGAGQRNVDARLARSLLRQFEAGRHADRSQQRRRCALR